MAPCVSDDGTADGDKPADTGFLHGADDAAPHGRRLPRAAAPTIVRDTRIGVAGVRFLWFRVSTGRLSSDGGLMTDRILVPFEGEGSGVGELSWGQREMWRAIQRRGSSLAIGGVVRLPAGTTVQGAAAELRFMMSRHQSLRTRLLLGGDGRERQVLAASGEACLEVIDADGADPAQVAEAVFDRFHSVEYDYVNEWPVRMAVIRQRGALAYMVVMYCHLAIDGGGIAALIADLATMDTVTGRSETPVPGMQPLEQARQEGTPSGQQRSVATLRRWEHLLRAIPASRFGDCASQDTDEPRFRQARYSSPAMHLAARLIAARNGVDTSAVLLAAFAVALARVTGTNPSVAQLVVGNRFRPGFSDTVSTISHPSLCVIDVADITFDEAVARAARNSFSAFKNAYYDPVRRDELIARIGRERGGDIDIACLFNDRRILTRELAGDPLPTLKELQAALPLTTLRWKDKPADPVGERFFVDVEDAPGTVELRVSPDTRYMSAAHTESFTCEMEAVTVEAAFGPGGVPQLRQGH